MQEAQQTVPIRCRVARDQGSYPATAALENSALSPALISVAPSSLIPPGWQHSLGHSCSISCFSCQIGLWHLQRCRGWCGDAGQHHCQAQAALVTVSQALGDKQHGRLFVLTVQVACSDLQNCPNTASLHSSHFQSLTIVHCSPISSSFTSSLYSNMKTSLSSQVTCLIHLGCTCIGREQPMFEHPRLHCWCFSSCKKPENLLRHLPHINTLEKFFPHPFLPLPISSLEWQGFCYRHQPLE